MRRSVRHHERLWFTRRHILPLKPANEPTGADERTRRPDEQTRPDDEGTRDSRRNPSGQDDAGILI